MRDLPFSLLAAAGTSLLFVLTSGIIGLTKGYGGNLIRQVELRFQTDAFLQGRLALAETPFGHHYDWCYGMGMQQCWGLGVPLLRLPFEAVTRVLGGGGFPDRVVFLLLFFGVSALLIHEMSRLLRDRVEAWLLGTCLLIAPAFLILVTFRFAVYEEVVSYGYLWSWLLFGLLLNARRKDSSPVFLLTAFAAGFAFMIRPTLCAVSGITALWLFYPRWRRRSAHDFSWSLFLTGIFLYVLGPALVLIGNHLRFGSPLEFGYSLNVSGDTTNDFALRFGAPFADVRFFAAAKELLAELFLRKRHFNDVYAYGRPVHDWVSNVLRFRELPVPSYSPLALTTLITAVAVFVKEKNATIRFAWLWAFPIVIFLFLFYLKSPSITSRYLVDFSAAISIIALGVYLHLRTMLKPPAKYLRFALAAWLFGVTLDSFDVNNLFHPPQAGTWAEAQAAMHVAQSAQPRPLPDEYRCDAPANDFGILTNNYGWDQGEGLKCITAATSTHYFYDADCVQIFVSAAILPDKHPLAGRDFHDYDRHLRAKKGRDFLERVAEANVVSPDGSTSGKQITFCEPPGRKKLRDPEIFTFAYFAREDLNGDQSPFLLHVVRKVSRPN